MFSFQELNARYHMEVSISTQKNRSVYACDYYLSAMKQKDSYVFIMEKRNVTIDGEPPKQIMDSIMVELTEALYPITLTVTPYREIIRVENFDEVRSRWNERSYLISQKYNSLVVDACIKDSTCNIIGETVFLQAFKRDSFVLNYFRPLEESFEYIVPDPKKNNEILYLTCKKKETSTDSEDKRFLMNYSIMIGEFGEEHQMGSMVYEMSEEGALFSFKCGMSKDDILQEKSIRIDD